MDALKILSRISQPKDRKKTMLHLSEELYRPFKFVIEEEEGGVMSHAVEDLMRDFLASYSAKKDEHWRARYDAKAKIDKKKADPSSKAGR